MVRDAVIPKHMGVAFAFSYSDQCSVGDALSLARAATVGCFNADFPYREGSWKSIEMQRA